MADDTTCLSADGFSHSPTIASLAAALVSAQQGFGPARATRENTFYSRAGKPAKYAPLVEVQRATLPVLQAHGLLLVQSPAVRGDGAMVVTTMIVHAETGEWLRGDVAVTPDPDKGIQGLFSACTYARRYGIASMTQVMVEDDLDEGDNAPSQRDDDANAATKSAPPPPKTPVANKVAASSKSAPPPPKPPNDPLERPPENFNAVVEEVDYIRGASWTLVLVKFDNKKSGTFFQVLDENGQPAAESELTDDALEDGGFKTDEVERIRLERTCVACQQAQAPVEVRLVHTVKKGVPKFQRKTGDPMWSVERVNEILPF